MTDLSVKQLASAVAALPDQAKAVATSIQQVPSVTHAMTGFLKECTASEPCDWLSLQPHHHQCQYMCQSAKQILVCICTLAPETTGPSGSVDYSQQLRLAVWTSC